MLEFLTQSLAHSSLADRIGWVLVHSLWQFALVALLAVVLQWALKRRSAITRYWSLLAAMFVMVAVPIATWFSPWCVDAPVVVAKVGPVENPEKVSPSHNVSLSRRGETMRQRGRPARQRSPWQLQRHRTAEPQRLAPNRRRAVWPRGCRWSSGVFNRGCPKSCWSGLPGYCWLHCARSSVGTWCVD